MATNPISGFLKNEKDIIALVLVVVFAVAGLLFRYNLLIKASMIVALINFVQIYFGSRDKQDERTQHHRNFAAYHTLIAIFILTVLISILYSNNVIRNIDIPLCCRIIVWSIGFMYAVAYSIIKRVM